MSLTPLGQCCSTDVLAVTLSHNSRRAHPPARIPRTFTCFTFEHAYTLMSNLSSPNYRQYQEHSSKARGKTRSGLFFALSGWQYQQAEVSQGGLCPYNNYSFRLADVLTAEVKTHLRSLTVAPVQIDPSTLRHRPLLLKQSSFQLRVPQSYSHMCELLGDDFRRQIDSCFKDDSIQVSTQLSHLF